MKTKKSGNRTKWTLNAYFVSLLLVVVLLGFTVKFFIRLPQFGDTYSGTLSTETYSSVESASLAYLSEEIDSPTSKSQIVTCKKLKTLNQAQINELGLDEEFREIEQVEITYQIGDKQYKSKIYACYLENNGYKYFAPPIYTGENITDGYYRSVISTSAFQNCTLNLQTISSIEIFGVPIKTTVNYTMKIANNYAYYKEKSQALGVVSNREIYCFDGPDGVYGILKESVRGKDITGEDVSSDRDWTFVEVILPFGCPKSISEFSMFGIYEGMDHSFFEKTQTGFATKNSRKKEFTTIVAQNLTRRAIAINNLSGNKEVNEMLEKIFLSEANWDYDCNYVVNDGHLRQAYLKQHLDLKNVDWKELTGETPPDWFSTLMSGFSANCSSKCDIVNIGTTAFTVDPDAQKLIASYQLKK